MISSDTTVGRLLTPTSSSGEVPPDASEPASAEDGPVRVTATLVGTLFLGWMLLDPGRLKDLSHAAGALQAAQLAHGSALAVAHDELVTIDLELKDGGPAAALLARSGQHAHERTNGTTAQ